MFSSDHYFRLSRELHTNVSVNGLSTRYHRWRSRFSFSLLSVAPLWNCGRPQAIIVHRRNVQDMEMAHQRHKDRRTLQHTTRAIERCQFVSVTGPIQMIRRLCPASRRMPFESHTSEQRAAPVCWGDKKSARTPASSKHKSTLINKRKSKLDRHSSAFSSCGRFCWILNQRGFRWQRKFLWEHDSPTRTCFNPDTWITQSKPLPQA